MEATTQTVMVRATHPSGRWRAGRFWPHDWTEAQVDALQAKALRDDPTLQVRTKGEIEADAISTELGDVIEERDAARRELEQLRRQAGEVSRALRDQLTQSKADLEKLGRERDAFLEDLQAERSARAKAEAERDEALQARQAAEGERDEALAALTSGAETTKAEGASSKSKAKA